MSDNEREHLTASGVEMRMNLPTVDMNDADPNDDNSRDRRRRSSIVLRGPEDAPRIRPKHDVQESRADSRRVTDLKRSPVSVDLRRRYYDDRTSPSPPASHTAFPDARSRKDYRAARTIRTHSNENKHDDDRRRRISRSVRGSDTSSRTSAKGQPEHTYREADSLTEARINQIPREDSRFRTQWVEGRDTNPAKERNTGSTSQRLYSENLIKDLDKRLVDRDAELKDLEKCLQDSEDDKDRLRDERDQLEEEVEKFTSLFLKSSSLASFYKGLYNDNRESVIGRAMESIENASGPPSVAPSQNNGRAHHSDHKYQNRRERGWERDRRGSVDNGSYGFATPSEIRNQHGYRRG